MVKNEYRGEWFSPNYENVKLPGVLFIDKKSNKITLKTYSEINFKGHLIKRMGEIFPREKIILGLTEDGSQITLYDYSGREDGAVILSHWIGGKTFESVFEPSYLFIGTHLKSSDQVKFKSYTFRYSHFSKWFDVHRKYYYREFKSEDTVTITNSKVPDYIIPLENGCTIRIICECFGKGDFSLNHKMKVKHFARFEFDTPQSFFTFQKISASFREFLTFAIGHPIHTIEENAECLLPDHWHKLDSTIEILSSRKKKDKERIWDHDMFFCSKQFSKEQLKEFIINWFKIYDKFQAAIDIFIHAVHPFWEPGNTTVKNVQFTNGLLNIAQSIETFYRRDNLIEYSVQRKSFDEHRNSLISSIKNKATNLGFSKDDVQFLNNYLIFGKTKDDISFKNIILYFLNKLNVALGGYFLDDEKEGFAESLKNFRNECTHVDHENSADLGSNYDLPYLFHYSQILFYSIVLERIGVSQTQINAILADSKRYARYYKQ
jgi:hypothetical protein